MKAILFKFIQPYLLMLLSMTYSLQQGLEGLGLNETRFEPWRDGNGTIVGSMINVDASLALPMISLLLLAVVWIALVMIALRTLWGRHAMWLGLLLLALPGSLSAIAVWPDIHWLPRSYVIGSGYVGSPWGMLLLQAFTMAAGWAFTVLLTHRLKLDDRFRYGYDQFWYALAISAGLFFVADLDAARLRDDLRQSVAMSRAASSYLLDQVQRLDAACQSGDVKLPLACAWASRSQWQLANYAHYNEKQYWQLGPEQEGDIYTGSSATQDDKTVDALRQELHQYNIQMCPITNLGAGITQSSRLSRVCQISPAEFCTSFPSRNLASVAPIDGMTHTVAIANECIIPTLFQLKTKQVLLASAVDDNERTRHLRTVFFILVSLIAGGKVANASVRMTEAIRKEKANNAAGSNTSNVQQSFSQRWKRLANWLRRR